MIKKFLLLFFFLYLIFTPSLAITLKGNVSYTVNRAKKEAFDGVTKNIDIAQYSDYLNDKYHEKNINNITKKKFKFKSYYISSFNDGSYSITYRKNEKIGYYYYPNGKLKLIEFSTLGKYPRRSIRYDASGQLDSTSLDISNNETYIFGLNKKLIAHWIGDNCYNEKGELIGKRKSH